MFFGGGTPSLMEPELVYNIIATITKLNNNKPLLEVTLESNPSSVEISKLRAFKDAGVNRVSIGVQSFNDNSLQVLGRNHGAKEAIAAITMANKVFNRVSFDLINGLPGQTLADWQTELKTALPFINSHLSVYELTIEPGTPFFKQKVPTAKSKLAVELLNYTISTLAKRSIYPYEISNYAKIGQESLHNLQYWQGGLYLGVGPGAHGRIIEKGNLYTTTSYKNPQKWLQLALENKEVFSEYSLLTQEERILELLILNLRLYKAIPLMLRKYIKEEALLFLQQEDLLKKEQNNFYITLKGKMRLNSVIEYLSNYLVLGS